MSANSPSCEMCRFRFLQLRHWMSCEMRVCALNRSRVLKRPVLSTLAGCDGWEPLKLSDAVAMVLRQNEEPAA